MNLIELLYLTALIFGLLLSANSQIKDFTDIGKLESYLNAIHLKKKFNGEMLIAKGEDILFQKTVGLASYENKLELSKGAKYRKASITKTFTGTLIAIAQEEQKLNIQDKASDYINDLSPKFRDVTIEQLLMHTSGLPHNGGIKDYWLTKSKIQITPEQAITEINALDLLFKPGSKMNYSSLGYSTYMAAYPENNISIIILSNVSTLPISDIAADVEKIVFEKSFQMPSVEEVSEESIKLEIYSGTFISDSNKMTLSISTVENSLYAKLGNNPPFEIYPKGNHQFFGEKIEIAFTFEFTNDLITGLSAERMGQLFHFKKDTK